MIPAEVTDEMVEALNHPLNVAVKRTFVGGDDSPNVSPCEAVVHRASDGETAVIRVPLHLEPEELTRLLAGGQVWISMFGGLSPFAVEVVAADTDDGSMPHAQKALFQRETEAVRRSQG